MGAKGVAKNDELDKLLADSFGVSEFPADSPPVVDRARHFELAKQLKQLGYRIYVTVVATHYLPQAAGKAGPEQPELFEIATVLRKPGKGADIATWRVKLAVGEGIESLVPLYAGADWQEREQYDLVGVVFENHPDLRRLMMPDDWEGHPLRKDYAIDTACSPWR
ncbi:MAG: NADH-quinone oxidoreductase subunit C [Myxococcales bacterium]|nr:NADH-quinone oxidoreductase subunit C [Myxococcales bacterium]